MSQLSNHYRQMAAKARTGADRSALPKVKELHSRSADRLDQMVQRLDSIAEAKSRNDVAKDRLCRAEL